LYIILDQIMFTYKSNALHCENVNLLQQAQAIPTPFFCYSKAHITQQYTSLLHAFASTSQEVEIFYAVKSNDVLSIIQTLGKLGAGCDATSSGEVYKCLKSGISPKQIIFSGVGKSKEDIQFAVESGVINFNVESIAELELLQLIAASSNKTISVMTRVNLDVDANTHDKITTSRKGDKFGMDMDTIVQAKELIFSLKNIEWIGLAVHLGSQITDLSVYEQAFSKLAEFTKSLLSIGVDIQKIDFGGGLGIQYTDEETIDITQYAKVISKVCKELKVKAVIEPGRFLVGNSGLLVSQVLYVKKADDKELLVIDAGMNNLLRPALYEAVHHIASLKDNGAAPVTEYEVVGPLCESGDKIVSRCQLPTMKLGDYIAIKSAGAYGSVMSSNYNAKPMVAEYLIEGDQFNLIRHAQSFSDLIARDINPLVISTEK
jgi:diaminopimelate decarboxylase